MADRYWVGGSGTWNTTSTTNWSATSGGSGGASVPTTADSVFFDQASTYTVTMTGALNCLSITVSAGTVTFATGTTPTLNVNGSMSLVAGTVWNSTGLITLQGNTKTITSNGTVFNCNITQNFSVNTNSCTLLDNLTLGTTNTFTLNTGTIALGSYTLSTGLFSSPVANTRTINFGTGKIVLTNASTNTIWNVVGNGVSVAGTPLVECIGGGTGVTKTISSNFPIGEASGISFSLLETTGTVTYTFTNDSYVRNLVINGSQTLTNSRIIIWGDYTYSNTNGTTTFSAGTSTWTFAATSGTKSITPGNVTYDFPWTFNGVGGTWALQSNLTVGSTRATTLTAGTLNLNDFTLSTGTFSSNNSNTRTIAFGTTGQITLSGSNTTVLEMSTMTGFTDTGTPRIYASYGAGVGTRTFNIGQTAGATTSNIFDLSFATTGTGLFINNSSTDSIALNGNYLNANFTNCTNTVTNVARTIYGNLTIPATGGTFSAGSSATTLANTTTTNITVQRTIDFPVTINGVGGTFTLQNNLTLGATRTLTLTNGTFECGIYTVSPSITVATGTTTINNLTGSIPITHSSGTLILGTNTSTGAYTLTSGTLNLNNFTLTATTFASNNSNVRSISFGTTGQITLTANAATVVDMSTMTNFTYSGTPRIYSSYNGATGTRVFDFGLSAGATASNVFDLSFGTSGTGLVINSASTDTLNLAGNYLNADFTNCTNTIASTSARSVYANLTIPATGGTFSSGSNGFTMRTTTSANISILRTIDVPITISAVGGTVTLQSTITITSLGMTLDAGTLNLNNYTVTLGSFSSSNSNTRSINFGTTGQITLPGNSASLVSMSTLTGFTYTGTPRIYASYAAGTGTRTFSIGSSGATASNVFDVSFATSGTGLVINNSSTDSVSLGGSYLNVNFTNCTNTITNQTRTIFGNLTIPATGGTFTGGLSITTMATTSSANISVFRTIDFPFEINAVGGTVTLQNNLNISSRDFSLTSGTLALNNYTISALTLTSNNSNTRSISFGTTGQITLTGGNAVVIQMSVLTGFTYTGTPRIYSSHSGGFGTRTFNIGTSSGATASNVFDVSFGTSGTGLFINNSADQISLNGGYNNVDFTNCTSTVGNNATRTIYGNLTIPATGGTFSSSSAATVFATVTTANINVQRTIDFPITINAIGTVTLQNNLSLGPTAGNAVLTITAGTLNLANYTVSASTFSSNSSNTRTIAFGTTGQITLSGFNNTIIEMSTMTGFSYTGTPRIYSSYNSSVGTRTFNMGQTAGATQSNTFDLSFATTGTGLFINNSSTDSIALNGGYANSNFTNCTNTVTNATRTIFGNLTIPATGGTFTAGASATSLGTTTTANINVQRTIDFPITVNGVGGVNTLVNNLTLGATRVFTLTNGTMDFSTYTLTASGITVITGSAGVRNLNTALAVTHTSGTLTLGTNTTTGAYTLTAGTLALDTFTLTIPSFSSNNSNARSITFGTGKIVINSSTTSTIWNTATATNMTVTGTPLVECIGGGTSVTKTISTGTPNESDTISFSLLETSGTVTYAFTASNRIRNLLVNGLQTISNIAISIYGNYEYNSTNGTTTFTGGTNAWTFAATSGTKTITSRTATHDFPWAFNGLGGTWELQDNLTVWRDTTLTAGTLSLLSNRLRTGSFASSNSNTRTIAFGTGKILLVPIVTMTIWNTGTTTNMTVTGTPLVECQGGGTGLTKTINSGTLNEANSISFSLIETTGTVTYAFTSGNTVRDLLINGSQTVSNIPITIFGNYTYNNTNGNTTFTAGTNVWTFAATSGIDTITGGSVTYDFPWTFNGIGGNWQLLANTTIGTSRTVTVANGIVSLNGYTLSTGTLRTANGNSTFVFDGGTLNINGSGTSAFVNTGNTSCTFTSGTANGIIRMSSASAKTFFGNNATFPAVLDQAGAGTLTIVGNNSFNDLSSSISTTANTTISFTANTTTTLSSFTLSGSSTFKANVFSTVSGTRATINCPAALTEYVTGANNIVCQDISFTPFIADGSDYMRWYVGSGSTNVNSTGALFQTYSNTAPKVYVLESGSSWTVPDDWNTANNTIHIIGGGGGGGNPSTTTTRSGSGGGGGGYTRVNNVFAYKGQTISYTVGAGGAANTAGGNSSFYIYSAGGGRAGSPTANTPSGGVGLTYNGGAGGANQTTGGSGGGGGGGAAGFYGNGGSGGAGAVAGMYSDASGGGGGGNGGGTSGAGGSQFGGPGAGGNNYFGIGSGAATLRGTQGGGGGGGWRYNFGVAGSGGFGNDILNSLGSGGGGGGGGGDYNGVVCPGQPGGLYGGGGGGGHDNERQQHSLGAAGAQGVIIVSYVPGTAPEPPTPGSGSSMMIMFT